MEEDIEFYARWKTSWSRLVDEDYVTFHLSSEKSGILCGVDKRHIDVYDWGMEPLESIASIVSTRTHICKSCFKSWMKLMSKIDTTK